MYYHSWNSIFDNPFYILVWKNKDKNRGKNILYFWKGKWD